MVTSSPPWAPGRTPGPLVCGFTATPFRPNNTPLITTGSPLGCFDEVVYTLPLPWMIERQYLVPIVAHGIFVEGLDLDRIRTSHGDYSADALCRCDAHGRYAGASGAGLPGDHPGPQGPHLLSNDRHDAMRSNTPLPGLALPRPRLLAAHRWRSARRSITRSARARCGRWSTAWCSPRALTSRYRRHLHGQAHQIQGPIHTVHWARPAVVAGEGGLRCCRCRGRHEAPRPPLCGGAPGSAETKKPGTVEEDLHGQGVETRKSGRPATTHTRSISSTATRCIGSSPPKAIGSCRWATRCSGSAATARAPTGSKPGREMPGATG